MTSNKLGIQSLSFVVVAERNFVDTAIEIVEVIPQALIGTISMTELVEEIAGGPDDRIPDDGGDSVLCACVSYSKANGWTIEFDRVTI